MHEFSIIQALFSQIEDIANTHNAKSISKVYIIVGEVSGAEPHLLKVAFDTFKENTILQEAELFIEYQKPVIRCMECDKEFELEKYAMRCPECKSFKVRLVKGDELILKTLELDI